MHTPATKTTGFAVLLIVQIVILVLYWLFVRYGEEALPIDEDVGSTEGHVSKYPHFQDIQVMIFIGFGFLMTFLRKYGYSATGYSLFLAALVVQWSILAKGFFRMENGKIKGHILNLAINRFSLSLESIIDADIAAAVPLISMGALLGRTTPIQLLFMAIIETALFAVNEYVALDILSICDAGGSITVHAFGAYFGLAVSFILRPSKDQNSAGKYEGANYISDIFAMVGTLFLWVYWPSFNSVLVDGTGQERAILNTYLALAAATVTTFVISAIVSHENKLDMVHVQNSTLAGGVAAGTICNLLIGSHGAILVGMIAGAISVFGYRYLSPMMTSGLRIHDTCGVHNLHGMPAVLSAIASAIYAALVTKDNYKSDLGAIFPAMLSNEQIIESNGNFNSTLIMGGYNRSANAQAGYQLFGIALTVLVAIVGGILTGLVLKFTSVRKLQKEELHQDELYWEVPDLKDEYFTTLSRLLETSSISPLHWRRILLRHWNAIVPENNLYIRGAYK